jgi:hypothetical protein
MKASLRILILGSVLALPMTTVSFAQSGTSTGTYSPSSGAAVSNNDAVNTANNRNATNPTSPSPSGGGGGSDSGAGGGSNGGGGAGGGSGSGR